ncbi:MAG: hypothetical protein Q9N34_06895 [Aquificota bacterium]|nr:hypothetical protein [Aquificota bacterium]
MRLGMKGRKSTPNLYIINGSFWFRFQHRGKRYSIRIARVGEISWCEAVRIARRLKAEIIATTLSVEKEAPTFKEVALKYEEDYRARRPFTNPSHTKRSPSGG